MPYKVFVDGQEGTTGLKIRERLANRADLDVLVIDSDKRRDTETRRQLLNAADIAFLCLPDEAARESVALVTNTRTRIIDASTAHRTHPDWVYGIPELSVEHRKNIRNSKRVSVPGCHASGFNLALYPLVQAGIVPQDYPIACYSVTGYSGGGKKLIEQYETVDVQAEALNCPRPYALGLNHKHLPEMQAVNGLTHHPLFTPILGNFYQGMIVSTPLAGRLLNKKRSAEEVHEYLASYYKAQKFVKVMPFAAETNLDNGFFSATACNGTNRLELFVFGQKDQILLSARLDNLGKGSSGAAVQVMNVMLGVDEALGLTS